MNCSALSSSLIIPSFQHFLCLLKKNIHRSTFLFRLLIKTHHGENFLMTRTSNNWMRRLRQNVPIKL